MAAIRPAISSVYHLPGCGTLIVLVEPRFKSDGEMRAPNWPIFLVHFPLTPLGKGCELRDFRTMDAHFPVHRLPGGQPQAELERHARLAATEALAVHELWRDRLPGAAGAGGQPADDAGGGGRGDLVLGP